MLMPRLEHVGFGISAPLNLPGRIRMATCWLAPLVSLLSMPMATIASAVAASASMPASTSMSAPTPTLDQVQQKMAGLSLPFEANQGQFAPEVAFAARTFAGTLFVTRDGRIVHALAGKPAQKTEAKQGKESQQNNKVTAAGYWTDVGTPNSQTSRGPGWALIESLQGAGKLKPAGSQPSATHVSRFQGNTAANHTSNIATFDRVHLGEAWPGVSVELAAHGNDVEKFFTVAPGTSPKSIRMGVAGAKRLRLGNDGSLITTTGNGDVAFTPPVAFQVIGGKRSIVPVRYALLADSAYRFEVGAYDRSQPLVIDPLLQSTYVGGNGDDQAFALAIDAAGSVLIAGRATSTNFPGTAGGAQPVNGAGFGDAFVARLSSNLGALLQATYLGGSGFDRADALAIDGSGNVLVAGTTDSANFPGTSGGAQPVKDGFGDVFVARLSSSLTTLSQATYFGGSSSEGALALAIDAGGNVLIAGPTQSSNLPGTAGGAQPSNGGGLGDSFVARLSSGLTTLVQATYLGGNGYETAAAMKVDAGGNVLVVGNTDSANFPATSGGAQPIIGSSFSYDGFVARLSGSLTTLTQSTYLGGSAGDRAYALALDAAGNVLIAGDTASTNFPGTSGSAQPASGGGFLDAFVARLSNDLTTLSRASYIGGNGSDAATALALDASGIVFVAGSTTSTNFPGTFGGVQPANGGGTSNDNDVFVVRLSGNLTALVQATYLGGNGNDQANAIKLDSGGNVVVAGSTTAVNFPGTSGGAQSASAGGVFDAVVARLTPDLRLSNDKIFANGFD